MTLTTHRTSHRVSADRVVSSTCPHCGVGCTLELHVKDDFIYKVTSPFDSPVNHGNLCVKGRFGYDYIYHPKRILTPAAEQSAMWRHSRRFQHTDTWLWVVQAITGMVILVMGSIHMWTVLTSLPITAGRSAFRIQGGWWLLFYMVLLPTVELHVGIGLYRIAVKWGFVTSRQRSYLKSMENRVPLAFIVVGAITLFTFYVIITASMNH